ncbi:DNA primase [Crateriforma conspicua]|uniref:DNA primase n=1 Tax=Crateriforma conspicua TaxID=2527996 RepID=A0A5C6FJK5_9PLAN|nr:DNA primase [Crateriforma conspicua]TWU62310.1 DNA primase [Crateriforma conspicua]TWU62316.1 DNA primase [Crateriforma conspicua]
MARFDQSVIDAIKTETDIVALIESYGTKLKPRGNSGELIGLCPIHDDKSPSLVVNKTKNVWNCLGACGRGGDVIEFVMAAEKTSFRHAVELLKERQVGAMAAGGTKAATTRRLASPITPTAEGRTLLWDVAKYYHERLAESPDALAYLAKRGIDNAEAVEHFRIGFCDRTLGLRLPNNQRKAGREMRSRLQDVGILKETGHELMRGCLTFPIFAADDHERTGVGEIYGRRIDDKAKQRHFYLPGPHAGIFNSEALAASDEIVLCESVIDAVSFWCDGVRNVTTIWGTNGFTDELRQAFRANEIRRILLAFDTDKAGKAATERISGELIAEGYEVFQIRFPGNMDANSYMLRLRGTGRSLQNGVRDAEWIGKGAKPARSSSVEAAKEKTTSTPNDAPEQTAMAAKASSLAAKIPGVEVATEPASEPVAAEPPTASPVPKLNLENQTLDAEITDSGIVMTIGNRVYRIRGLDRNTSIDSMKLNVMVRRQDAERFFVDTFDLYAARVRNAFTKEAATELGFDIEVIKRDLGRVLMTLETIQENKLAELEPKDKPVEIDDADKAAAMELLQSPNLVERILNDFDACGVVGEETNKLVGYLAATSRKLGKPLAVVIQSSSAAGKSSLMDAVLSFIPPEEQVGYSAMTGQSLFYMGGMELKNKILSIAEEEGVAQASYALKLLQSEGQLTIASTGKDPGSGRMETQEYHVEGPVMIFLTTTAIDIDEELMNRCIVLTVDENREQTRAIHDQQRENETLDGLLRGKRGGSVRKLHQNAQRLLRPLSVVNPFAKELRFIDDQARRRRDHMKYLSLIRSIALLHQYQREVHTVEVDGEPVQYVEVTRQDIALANRLSDQVLGKSIDELPPQTRRLLIELHELVRSECDAQELEQTEYRFTRRFIRERLGWGQTQVKLHVDRLIEMEYVLAHRVSGRHVEYELLYDGRGREGQPTMCGLIDVTKLPASTPTTNESSGSDPVSSGQTVESSPQDRPFIGPSSDPRINVKPSKNGAAMS